MGGSVSPKFDSKGSEESELKQTETDQASKRRKVVERRVVRVKIGENGGKLKNEGPPSDSWSWRKYGQKPIKGSPHPRGYYKCSTSKGCSAKKQVERCKTDASMLIITYTSTHNHPGDDDDDARELAIKTSGGEVASEDHFHYLHVATNEEEPFSRNLERNTVGFLLDEEPLSCCRGVKASSSTQKSEENDLFDELEDLPIGSAFTGFMRSKFFDEGIPVVPF